MLQTHKQPTVMRNMNSQQEDVEMSTSLNAGGVCVNQQRYLLVRMGGMHERFYQV